MIEMNTIIKIVLIIYMINSNYRSKVMKIVYHLENKAFKILPAKKSNLVLKKLKKYQRNKTKILKMFQIYIKKHKFI